MALNDARTAVEFAQDCGHPFNRALATTYLAMLQMWRADADAFLACAGEACDLAAEYQAPYYHAWAGILRCFARAIQSPDAAHLSEVREAIQRFSETGARIRLPVYYSLLAEACRRAGQWEDGLGAVELALAQGRQSNERWWDAEIHRLRGELLWARGADPRDIEAAFRCALDIAQGQGARSLELRSATSLARFWRGW